MNHGSSQVEVGDDGVAAPVEFYIGNTTPAANEETVGAVLVKCAKFVNAQTDFKVLKVVQLAKHIENPRTKCWKVVIPYRYKDTMQKDEMYPAGWCHRKFFAPRNSVNPAKQPRKEEGVVQEVLNEQQRLDEAKRQEEEDRERLEEADRHEVENRRHPEQMAVDNSGQSEAATAQEMVDNTA